MVPENTLLLLVRGSMLYNCIPVGITKKTVTFNQDVKALTFNEQTTVNYMLQWFLHYESKLLNMVVGTGIGAGKLETSDVQNISFGLPSKPEQKKIASFLTAVDSKIEQLTKKRSLLEQYKKGVMQKIFSREIRFRAEDGSAFPEWEEKKIGDVLKVESGKDYKHIPEGNIPVYGTGGYMTSIDSFLYDGESVCIGRKGTINKPIFISGKFWTVDTLFYTSSFKALLPKYFYYFSLQTNWLKYNEGTTLPSLSKKTIENIHIALPSIEEQTKIADFLSSIDIKIDLVAKELENAKQFKKGLLQQMFV